jgi:hypothetical protein
MIMLMLDSESHVGTCGHPLAHHQASLLKTSRKMGVKRETISFFSIPTRQKRARDRVRVRASRASADGSGSASSPSGIVSSEALGKSLDARPNRAGREDVSARRRQCLWLLRLTCDEAPATRAARLTALADVSLARSREWRPSRLDGTFPLGQANPVRHTPSIGKQGLSNAIKGRKIDVENAADKRTRLELDCQTERCTCDLGARSRDPFCPILWLKGRRDLSLRNDFNR